VASTAALLTSGTKREQAAVIQFVWAEGVKDEEPQQIISTVQ
jgi:hypothetical protein